MENCTIYSHHLEFDKIIEIVKAHLPKASIEQQDGGLQKSLVATIKGGLFGKNRSLKINYRQRQNPSYNLDKIECGLTQNLAGMLNYIQSIPAKNEEIKSKFVYKVMSANCEMPFMAEPEITGEMKSILKKICSELDAFLFCPPTKTFNKSSDQHFLDKDLNLILDSKGHSEIYDLQVSIDAKYHDEPTENYIAEQLERKEKSEKFLASKNIKTNKNLPCIPSSENTELRTTKMVVDRAFALMSTAAKGEGVPQDQLLNVIKTKNIKGLSQKEQEIINLETLTNQQKAYATWRYESLQTILWALNIIPQLKFPNEICDVADLVGKMLKPEKSEFEKTARLRTKDEILNELDKTYRMHWACVDARIKDQQVSGTINPSIIYERHYALNWITSYLNQDWDQVQTNT